MNTPNGSTSATLEDPTDNQVQPTKPAPQGSDKLPEDDEPQKDAPPAEAEDTDDEVPAGDKPAAPAATKPDAKPAPVTDPVQAAIARLATDAPAAPKAKAAPPGKAGDKPAVPGKAAAEGETETRTEEGEEASSAQQREADPNDPLNGWTKQERQHTKGTVKERFRQAHARIQELEPVAQIGTNWSALVKEKELASEIGTLDDDQIAWSLRAQGAAVRAIQARRLGQPPAAKDLETIDQLRIGLAEIDKALGRPTSTNDPKALAEGFKGAIPEDLQEAAEVAGLSDMETRLIAALRAKPAATPTPAPAAAPAPGAPHAPTAPAAPRATQPPAGGDVAPEDQRWARESNQEIVKKAAIAPAQAQAFFDRNLSPLLEAQLIRDFPGQSPIAVFQRMGPQLRHTRVMKALDEHLSRPQSTTPSTPTGKRPLRVSGGGSGTPAAPADPVQAAIAHLASDG